MKNLFLSVLGLSLLLSCSTPRPDEIERPIFEVTNTTTLEIDKIVMTDSSTVIYFDAYFRPHWWIKIVSDTYIRESGSDERMFITHAEGIDLDTEFFMPESGETSFKLFFPPLPPGVTKIDFIESDCADCFKIWGINLLPGTKIKMADLKRTFKSDKKSELPKIKFSDEPAKISGKIYGYNKENYKDEIRIGFIDISTFQSGTELVAISPNGDFSVELYTGLPQMIYMGDFGLVLAKPGEETKVYLDLKKKSRYESRYRTDKEASDSLYYVVESESVNDQEFLFLNSVQFVDLNNLMQEAEDFSPAELLEYFKLQIENKLNEDEYKNLSDNQKLLLASSLKAFSLHYLISYKSLMSYVKYLNSGLPQDRWGELQIEIEEPDLDYYVALGDFFDENILLFQEGLVSVSFMTGLVQFSLRDVNATPEERFLYYKENAPDFLIENNLFHDLACLPFFAGEIEKTDDFEEHGKDELLTLVKDPMSVKFVLDKNKRTRDLIEKILEQTDTDFIINETPKVENDKVYETILDLHKGKVVVVDFWATWCGPCIASIEPMKEVKKEFQNEEIVYIYLTDESSPKDLWVQFLSRLDGHHYRFNNELMYLIKENLDVTGIPTFFVYDKEGKEIAKHVGFPGPDTMKESVREGL